MRPWFLHGIARAYRDSRLAVHTKGPRLDCRSGLACDIEQMSALQAFLEHIKMVVVAVCREFNSISW